MKPIMARRLALLSLTCLAVAVGLALHRDPWTKANARAAQDAQTFAQIAMTPTRMNWELTRSPFLNRIIVWDGAGNLLYPTGSERTPFPLEISREMAGRLAELQQSTNSPTWIKDETAPQELLNCRASPPICLIYDRAQLEDTLKVAPDALLGRFYGHHMATGLTALAIALAFAACRSRARKPASGGFELFPDRLTAQRNGIAIDLSPRDVKLLVLLKARDGAVVTKDELYDAGWGRDYMPNSRALDQHIINLRRKLDPDRTGPAIIETVRGVGYRFVR